MAEKKVKAYRKKKCEFCGKRKKDLLTYRSYSNICSDCCDKIQGKGNVQTPFPRGVCAG